MGTCLDFTSANPHPHSTAGRWVGNWLRPSWGLCIPGNESSLASTEMLFPILGSVWSFQEPRTLWQRNAALPASWLSLFPVHTVFLQNKIPRWKHSYYVLNLTARTSLVAQTVKNLPAMLETRARSLGREDPLEEEMTTHSRILAWEIPCAEELGGATGHGVAKRLWRHVHPVRWPQPREQAHYLACAPSRGFVRAQVTGFRILHFFPLKGWDWTYFPLSFISNLKDNSRKTPLCNLTWNNSQIWGLVFLFVF